MKPSEKLARCTFDNNIPLMCVFELTQNCNLKCKHCYISRSNFNQPAALSTIQIKKILKQLAKAGSLHLVFTGGEIFLRPDIIELCSIARKLQFDLRIFTNGTLIDDEKAYKLSQMNLSGIEISLYGKEKTHDFITGVPGSYKKTLNAVKLLNKFKLPLTVKCPLMKLNFKDYKWIKRFAAKHKINYRFDAVIAPKDSGDKSILKYRLNDFQLKKVLKNHKFSKTMLDKNRQIADLSCSAGHNLICIGSDGTVYPCLQLRLPLGNIKKTNLSKIWSKFNQKLTKYRQISFSDLSKCCKCVYSVICQRCPGLALLEDGDLLSASKISCKIAKIQCV